MLHNFFFHRVSATGFGLMRFAWGAVVFVWMLSMWQDVAYYYSNEGMITPEIYDILFRSEHRYTILDVVTTAEGVWGMYLLLLLGSLMTMAGILPRFSTILTVVLFFSFQERNLLPLGGGDTTLRTIGFLLAICPELRACSLARAKKQWEHWKKTTTLLPSLTMSIWPYRMLLWQAMIIYIYSGIEKISGEMWMDGTAVEVFFHNPSFFRWSKEVGDMLAPLSSFISYFTLIFEFAWFILLIPKQYLEKIPVFDYGSVKRGILICGTLFHVGIFVLGDVGIFPLAMLTLYIGLLVDDDWNAIRKTINHRWKGPITILYDGKCGMCRRSVFGLMMMDSLQRVQPIDFHDQAKRKSVAPKLTFTELDKAMHIVMPSKRTEKGFDAFRHLSWHIPLLWPVAPSFYVPGVPPIGRKIYSWIAKKRRKCSHESCGIS